MTRTDLLRLTAASSLAFALPQPGSAATLRPLRLVTLPNDTGAQVFYAQSQGYFAQAGFDAQVEAIANGAGIIAAVAGSTFDLGAANLLSIAIAHKRGLPITCVAAGAAYSGAAPTTVLMVQKTSPIVRAADLSGKTLAVTGLKTISELGARAWIDRNGGNSADVRFIELPVTAMPAALGEGRIDAALVLEPLVSEAKAHARVLADAYDAIGSNFMIAAWITTKDWAQANGAAIASFAGVMRQAATWARTHRREADDALAAREKVSSETLRTMTPASYADALLPALMQPVIDVAAKYGLLAGSFPAEELIFNAR